MKHILLALVLLFGVTGVVMAEDFEAGKDAFNQRDYATALENFRKAAEAGNAKAQNWLAWMYYYGKGVPQNNQEAVRWYVKAAEAGHTIAQVSLGKMYELGRGVCRQIPCKRTSGITLPQLKRPAKKQEPE